jgi:imidazolonepropionase
MRILIKNIKKLLQTYNDNTQLITVRGEAMQALPSISNAYLIIENKIITAFGQMDDCPINENFTEIIDATHSLVLPTWVDSHTHLVHATTREQEFADRVAGLTYEQIAQRGGGILNSAAKLSIASEQELYNSAWQRLQQAIALGTGAIEIKSGYGLSTAAEVKMLRVIKQLKQDSPIPVKASFLAAHAYPMAYRNNHQGYISEIINEMLPLVAKEGLADYVDVFCEQGFFSVDETDTILKAAAAYGLKPKIHANQLYNSGGVQIGVQHNAISVDHLESVAEPEFECLRNSNTIPTLLPGAAFFLAMHYQPARAMLDAGLPVALASDYNPGSCPSFNMNMVVSLAVSQMKMTIAEAINASTINAAAALEMQESHGRIQVGYTGSVIITTACDNEWLLPYYFGSNLIKRVIV